MKTNNQITKINNSYESEPSSGSGSSIGEQYYYTGLDDENMNLPYLMKPPSYGNEVTVVTSTPPNNLLPILELEQDSVEFSERILRYGVPVDSSQESLFNGFSNSYDDGKLKEQMYGSPNNGKEQKLRKCSAAETTSRDPSPGKLLFARFYDTVVSENSCNAVDMPVSGESVSSEYAAQIKSNNCSGAGSASSQLSFNGRIKSLTTSNTAVEVKPNSNVDKADETLLNHTLDTTQLTESFVLIKYSNERSPDLFADDDDEESKEAQAANNDESTAAAVGTQAQEMLDASLNKSLNCPTESSFAADDQTLDCAMDADGHTLLRNNCRREREMLRRIRKCLAGLPPPPALTIPQLDLFGAVLSRKQEINNFLADIKQQSENNNCDANMESSSTSSLFKPTHTLEETKIMGWKHVLGVRQHGLSFNLNRASESNEYLALSVIDRFIGAETASSYRNSPSSAKKRNARLKFLTQSPGNRLSHLAKRRAVFSSANLATTSQRTQSLLGPQLVMDKKKAKHRRKGTPKRKTPGSKKKTRQTPSSSARKRLFRFDLNKPGPSRETSKRALFQSPAKQTEQQRPLAPKPIIKPEIANRVEKSKRALFSPDNSTSSYAAQTAAATFKFESLLKRKRNADDDDVTTELSRHNSKLFRSSAGNLTPRALNIKSQSFCIGAGSSVAANSDEFSLSKPMAELAAGERKSTDGSSTFVGGNKMHRARSDMIMPSNALTDNQRKKLLWAVSQALKERKITAKHESFKQYAGVLARVVRRIFQEYCQKSSTSNSETLLRLAKKYVHNVTAGKNADDIYFKAKAQFDESKSQSWSRLSGYIGPEEYQQRKNSQLKSLSQQTGGSLQNIFAASCGSIDSFSYSQTSAVFSGTSNTPAVSQSSLIDSDVVHDMQQSQQFNLKSATKQPIQANGTLQNSSSKNNLASLALRENAIVDGEQRRSAQKNFTGRDQRNVSPYAFMLGQQQSGGIKTYTGESTAAGSAKVKRQITFDN